MLICRRFKCLVIAGLVAAGPPAASASAGQPPKQPAVQPAPAENGAPLTLQMALAQAREHSQQFLSAKYASLLATEDRIQARAALLPAISEFSQFIATQPNGTPSGVWVANDGPKVYNTWVT